MTGGSALWYLSRGGGIVTLTLLSVSMLLGIATWTRWASARWPRRFGTGLHRNVSLLALAFVALHVVSAVADGYVNLSLADALVPFEAGYRSALGRPRRGRLRPAPRPGDHQPAPRRLGWRRWRAMHWAAYACWPVAVLHGLKTGSDAGSGWFTLWVVTCIAAVGGAAVARWASARSASERVPA